MSATTRSLIRRPRQIEASWPTGAAVLAVVLYATGLIANPSYPAWFNIIPAVALLGISGWLASRTMRGAAASSDARQVTTSFQLERSVFYITTGFVVVRTLSALGVDIYPLIYLLLAFLVTFEARNAAIGAVLTALIIEWASHWLGTPSGTAEITTGIHLQSSVDLALLGTRSVFIALFGFLSYFVHGTEVMERRRRHQREVDAERDKMLRQAREFRLLNSGRTDAALAGRAQAEEMAVYDAVEAVQHTTYVSLSMLKAALKCNTCVLLWFDVRQENLRIKELVSDSDALLETEIKPAKGVVGTITRQREPLLLEDLRPGFRGIPYYRQPQNIQHFLGIPVIENGHLRGILCADRVDGSGFTSADTAVAEEAAAYILRAIENERMFTSIERTKFELSRFFEASRNLNGVLSPKDVYRVALESIASIVEYDFAAITAFDPDTHTHRIEAVDHAADFEGPFEDWVGRTFNDAHHETRPSGGLVAMVVENRHYLPYGGQVRESDPIIFTRDEPIKDIRSMLVLPLVAHDKAIGTLVICHRQAGQFGAERREMLEVVGNQVAISLQNARLYAQMEQMATTDGLTGLSNHRTFQSRLESTIARHRRTQQPFALVLTDIDHFKSVNDTHGHPAGDEVLRQVSKVFIDSLREVDVPCRYGGEEFAIILEDADRATAMRVANRLREDIGRLEFNSEQGTFKCTISMGVSVWPEDSEEKQPLIDLTDQALYYSKEHGRNQVTSADQL
ncbi:diguanylate cyclase [Bradymonas sediminis]|nr:diguanylate cyclase [Bradymonas sediminis]TDP77167.1 diguanylate cyclase with GAF sensor [Bradymonas sediminis]